MNKTYALLATVAAFALSAPAFADKEKFESKTKVEADSKGNYEETTKTKSTDAAGTTSTDSKDVEVEVNSDGSTEKTVKTTETTDPKGLMNKSKLKTEETTKKDKDGHVTEHKKTVN